MAPSWPLIGRESPISDICTAALNGTGTVIVAAAGQGKSALAMEVLHRLVDSGRRAELVLCRNPSDLAVHRDLAEDHQPDVLVVDDAHLMTEDAADQLWSHAAAGELTVVATTRSGEPMPGGVARLWTGGLCERLDLEALTVDQVHALLVAVLGGDVEDRLALAVHHRSEGNPLLIREIFRSARRSGAISRDHEVWRIVAPLPVDAGIADLIGGRLRLLRTAEREGADVLALGEPLPLGIAEEIVGAEVLEGLERQGIVQTQQTTDGLAVTLAHPLYGEVIRTLLEPLRTRRLKQKLLDAFDRDPDDHRSAVRRAIWRLDLGTPPSADELMRAARIARSVDAGAAERLARAAFADGHSGEAVLCLAKILVQQGRVSEVDQLLDGLDSAPLDRNAAAELLTVRALARIRLGKLAEASALFVNPARGLHAPSLQALYAQSETLDGRPSIGAIVAREIVADEAAPAVARCIAGLSLAAGGAFEGHYDEAARAAASLRRLCDAVHQELPFASGSMRVAGLTAATLAGSLDAASREAHEMYESALGDDDEWLLPRGASALGIVAFARGSVRTATRYFRITVATHKDFDHLLLRHNVAWLARAAAAAGMHEEARSALRDVDPNAPVCELLEFVWRIAEAAVFAAQGQLGRAIEHDLDATRRGAAAGLWGVASLAAFDALRYGGGAPAAALLASTVERVDRPRPALFGRVARAVLDADAWELDEVSTALEHLGNLLYAADVAHLAGRAHRSAGRRRASLQAVARSRELEGRCEGASRPWAAGAGVVCGLTRREQEVAVLAATGRSDAELAKQLGISIRTVQTHLAHAYTKLDINRRADLPEALVDTAG